MLFCSHSDKYSWSYHACVNIKILCERTFQKKNKRDDECVCETTKCARNFRRVCNFHDEPKQAQKTWNWTFSPTLLCIVCRCVDMSKVILTYLIGQNTQKRDNLMSSLRVWCLQKPTSLSLFARHSTTFMLCHNKFRYEFPSSFDRQSHSTLFSPSTPFSFVEAWKIKSKSLVQSFAWQTSLTVIADAQWHSRTHCSVTKKCLIWSITVNKLQAIKTPLQVCSVCRFAILQF